MQERAGLPPPFLALLSFLAVVCGESVEFEREREGVIVYM
jgi:hypothetical protein